MALSNFFSAPEREGRLHSYPVYQSTKLYAGALVALNSTGYAIAGTTTAGLLCVGRCEATVDNSSGSSGDKTVTVKRGVFRYANYDAIAATDRGKPCFMYSDYQVALNSGSSVAGTIEDVDSAGVWVDIGTVNGTSLAAEIVSRAAITTDLAVTNNAAKGAALVGVTDTAGKYTATTVEAALAEDADARRLKVNTTSNTIGSAVIQHRIAVPSGASSTVSVTLDATFGKILITDVHFVKGGSTGGASDTVKLTDGTNDITDAIALSTKAAGAVVRAASISPTYGTVAAGGTLVANYTNSTTSCEGTLYVTGLRVS